MPRKITEPILRPTITFIYPRDIGKLARIAAYHAYSRWQEMLYPEILAQTPVTKSTDYRKERGFVKRHIKLVTRVGEEGLKYKTISVPGGTVKGSPAYHALSAIYAYHGHPGRPLTIRAHPGSVLTFPLKRGEIFRNPSTARRGPGKTRGPARWVVTKKVFQPRWGKKNEWITRIFYKNKGTFVKLLRQEQLVAKSKAYRRKKVIKIEVG